MDNFRKQEAAVLADFKNLDAKVGGIILNFLKCLRENLAQLIVFIIAASILNKIGRDELHKTKQE